MYFYTLHDYVITVSKVIQWSYASQLNTPVQNVYGMEKICHVAVCLLYTTILAQVFPHFQCCSIFGREAYSLSLI